MWDTGAIGNEDLPKESRTPAIEFQIPRLQSVCLKNKSDCHTVPGMIQRSVTYHFLDSFQEQILVLYY